MALTIEKVDSYFQQRPYYWTDGIHFRANLSGRKRKGWRYLGRFLNSKEAKAYYERAKEVCPSAFPEIINGK
jgi:hypothetical protein